ncbi:restriction endonuclease subunit S [Leuconostoc mesenteroides]|nr:MULTISPECIES: restriction endonuclease subunit S [Leuconostoc]MBZ1519451.1 restriction endonuclease subunit S [Leuconostoc mesenteroides]MBZ1521325.1 restriction endonuclease subunit S [Leuconostoc mesenteroides]MCT3058870.1 hypothetical protein [Leuconostoc citreum]
MTSIDTKNWNEFIVSDIFETNYRGKVPTGAAITKKNLIRDELNGIPRVTATEENNGIFDYYKFVNIKNWREYRNFISVSFLGAVFYHKQKATLDMKIHCLRPLEYELNDNTGLFMVTIIKFALSEFDYGDQLSSTALTDLKIKLPVDRDKHIDWEFMDNFIENERIALKPRMDYLTQI